MYSKSGTHQLNHVLYFYVLFIINFKTVYLLELCQQYSLGGLPFNSFYCIDYCCGSCNFRYCCSNETYTIDQKRCENNLPEPTELTTLINKNVITLPTSTSSTKKLVKITTKTNYDSKEKNESNEIKPPSSSSSILTETCESFQDLYGYSIQARKCPSFAKFCCGRCMNRYCCDLNKERLNQKECKSMSVTSTIAHSSNSFSYVYVILILGLVIILAFTCVPFFIFINKRSNRNRQQSNLNAIQNLTPLAIIGPSQSTTSLNSLPKITNNPNNDDMPPAYSTLKFNQSSSET